MYQVLLIFAILAANGLTEGLKLKTRLHMKLQAEPDQACTQWLQSQAGQEFLNCEAGNPGPPVATNNTNCLLTAADFDTYCNDTCFPTLTKAYDFMLQTNTCLPVYADKYKPCNNNTDCGLDAVTNRTKTCFQGFCYTSCNTTADCNSCLNETCDTLGQSQGCRSSWTRRMSGQDLANRTIENAFRGMIYQLKAGCSKNSAGNYCAMMDLTNATCATLSQYGCCPATILPSIQYCEWTNFTNPNMSQLFNCNFTQPPCQALPAARQYCQIVPAVNITPNGSSIGSGSSSMSGSMSGSSISSIISSMTSSSSGVFISSSTTGGIGGGPTGTQGGNGAGRQTISWTIVITLVLAAHIVS
jgi:hypothetical protein